MKVAPLLGLACSISKRGSPSTLCSLGKPQNEWEEGIKEIGKFDEKPEDLVLTVAEVSSLLNLDKCMVYRLVRDGVLPAIKVDGCWVFLHTAVETITFISDGFSVDSELYIFG